MLTFIQRLIGRRSRCRPLPHQAVFPASAGVSIGASGGLMKPSDIPRALASSGAPAAAVHSRPAEERPRAGGGGRAGRAEAGGAGPGGGEEPAGGAAAGAEGEVQARAGGHGEPEDQDAEDGGRGQTLRHPQLLQGPAGGGRRAGEGHGERAAGGGDPPEPPPEEPVRRAADDRAADAEGLPQARPGPPAPRGPQVRPLRARGALPRPRGGQGPGHRRRGDQGGLQASRTHAAPGAGGRRQVTRSPPGGGVCCVAEGQAAGGSAPSLPGSLAEEDRGSVARASATIPDRNSRRGAGVLANLR